jgi:hypothetical protein
MGGILSLSDETVKPLKGLMVFVSEPSVRRRQSSGKTLILTYFGQFFGNSAIVLSFVT